MGNCCSSAGDDERKARGGRHLERETTRHVRFADSSSSLPGNVSHSGGGNPPRNTSPLPLVKIERTSADVHLHSKTSSQCLMMRRLDEASFSPTRFFFDMEDFDRIAPLRNSQSVEESCPLRSLPPSPDGTGDFCSPCFTPISPRRSVLHTFPRTPPLVDSETVLCDAGIASSKGFGGLQPSKEKRAQKTSPRSNSYSSSESLSGLMSSLSFIKNVFGDEFTGSINSILPSYDDTWNEAQHKKRSFQFSQLPLSDSRYLEVNDTPVRRAVSSFNLFNRQI